MQCGIDMVYSHVVGPYSMFLLPVVNNPDSLFRCTRCINKADFNIVSLRDAIYIMTCDCCDIIM